MPGGATLYRPMVLVNGKGKEIIFFRCPDVVGKMKRLAFSLGETPTGLMRQEQKSRPKAAGMD